MEASRIIFLDCDGVLANARSQLLDFDEADESLLHDALRRTECMPLEKRCLSNLRRLVETTSAYIVLTTTWRLDRGQRSFLVEALEREGMLGIVIGDTPSLNSVGRGEEVMAWLREHPGVESFVVLDDDDKHIPSFERALPPGHFVQTVMRDPGGNTSNEGLTTEKMNQAIAILSRSSVAGVSGMPQGSVRHVGVIRHSARLDDDATAMWDDIVSRPYDTPISDFDLPCVQARALLPYGFTRIVSSPFRRCLQTAAQVAKELGVSEVEVHLGLGESMAAVKRDGWRSEENELSYLAASEMGAIMEREKIRLAGTVGEQPSVSENSADRFRTTLEELLFQAASVDRHQVLLVSHGDAVGQLVEMATGETVLEVEYCAWAVFQCPRAATPSRCCPAAARLVGSYGVTAMSLD